jgi:Ser/Thr protein kinase RdoA (MazF antagonist)
MAESGRQATDREVLSHVLGFYRLGSLQAARRLEQGFVDDNWIVETDRGRFFVKRRHPRRRQSDHLIRAQHELMQFLRRGGFPAPVIVPTAGGERFLLVDGEVYEIAECIEGAPYDPDRPQHLVAAGETLGQYHTLVKGLVLPVLRGRAELYRPANARTELERLREAWQIEHDPGLLEAAREIEAQIEALAARFAEHTVLPRWTIHGDYHGGNLLFQGDRIVGVVDYDKINWQPRITEVVEALIYFSSPRPGHLRYLVYPGFLERRPFARFLQGYARTAGLDEDEIQALPDYVWCIWLSMSLYRLWQRQPHRPPGAPEALQEVLALGAWASAHTRQMVTETGRAMEKQI